MMPIVMRGLSNVKNILINPYPEIDMELSESDIMNRSDRKKEFINNTQYLVEKRQREWLIKHGKSNLLAFQDE